MGTLQPVPGHSDSDYQVRRISSNYRNEKALEIIYFGSYSSEESVSYFQRRKFTRKPFGSICEDDNNWDNKESQSFCDKEDPSIGSICTSGQCENKICCGHLDQVLDLTIKTLQSKSRNMSNFSNASGDDDDRGKNSITESELKDEAFRTLSNVATESSSLNYNKKISSVIIRSAAARTASSVTIALFNVILFSTFLLNSINYLQVVKSEIFSNPNFNEYQVENLSVGIADHEFNYSYAKQVKVTRDKESERMSSVTLTAEDYLKDLLSLPLGSLDKRTLNEALWNVLTSDEIHRIFGHHLPSSTFLKSVPNFDLTQPKVTHLHHQTSRRRRSMGLDEKQIEKLIELEGFGRQFTLSMYPNQKLLDPHFAHLHRHENQSEILPHELATKQLKCFYHGSASHQGEVNDIETGTVAMNLCGGLEGFILSSKSSQNSVAQQYHYAIHPLPDRLLKSEPERKSADRKDHQSSSAVNERHNRHHIIFRRPVTIFPGIPLPIKSPTQDDSQSTLHITRKNKLNVHKNDGRNIADDDTDKVNSGKPVATAKDSVEFSTCMQHDSGINHEPVSPQQRAKSTITSTNVDVSNSGINDPESLTEKILSPPTSRSNSDTVLSSSRNFQRRQKRSSSFDTKTIEPFKYKPINIAPDSYWGQFRERGAGSPSSSRDLVSTGPARASRKTRDGGVLDKLKSSLNSEIIWEDRSKEISKQSRFEDLSNVKDRPPSHLTIETAIFVDKDLYKLMQQNFPDDTQGEVTRFVLAMINAVQLFFQDPSLGHRIDFVLKRLEVLETDPPGLIRPFDEDRFLTNFCKWQKTENPSSDSDPLHWDHALILTGLDLYVVHQSGKISNQVVGLSPIAGMCTRSSSCSVNEGRHFESVFVVAHDIGHNLGMRHDGPQAGNNCDPSSHIMSPTLGSGKNTWSPCSQKYLDLFLDTPQAKCLFDKAASEKWLDHNDNGRLPGERFDADRQCVLKYGRGSFHATQQPLEDVCRDLHCRREFFTWTSHPALDGTRCSAEGGMWCRACKCVQKITGPTSPNPHEFSGTRNYGNFNWFSGGSSTSPGRETSTYANVTPKAFDGRWGKWSPFTDCSSACLYADDGTLTMRSKGVKLSVRRCDSARLENGGLKKCSGPDIRYKTCSAHKICSKNPTRTTVSQYTAEVCRQAAQVDTDLTERGKMSSSRDPERACSVWCDTNDNSGAVSRERSFPDGTSCELTTLPKNAQTFCVAGKCQEFTCNPYSHFRLSEDDCTTSKNDGIPNVDKNRNSHWSGGNGTIGSGVKINHKSGKVGWSDWEVQSDCKLACLAPAKGLQLVKRQCTSNEGLCNGLSLSVRLCKPDKFSLKSNGCSRLQTPFEYATKVCSKYSDNVIGLSGIGMQLSRKKNDIDRPCRIGCQDSSIATTFYMVSGEEGWFPPGTDCSKGDQNKKAYCIAGNCVDFGDDDTPIYRININVIDSLFQLPRSKRQSAYTFMEHLQTVQ